MCIGIPMQVREVEPGRALTAGRGQQRWLNTLLIGRVQPGDWVLAFLDSARELISPERAAEVNAVLDMVEASLGADPAAGTGAHGGFGDPFAVDAFVLPSHMSAQDLHKLTGS